MLKKFLKIFFILFIMFSFCINFTYATDINLNLPGTDSNITQDTSEDNSNIQDNTVVNNESTVGNTVDDANTLNDPFAGINEETLQSSGSSVVSESGLGITNIINILLITVGVVLILLGIAIMIRLKN